MSLVDDCRELAKPWLEMPQLRTEIEILALKRTFLTVPANNDARKHFTSILVLTWSVLTVGFASGHFSDPSVVFYGPFTALVWMIIGRMWGLEVQGLVGPLQIGNNDDE